ncbi:Uncharacterised protein [Candidatus Anstonella stagnisolia]|nr:Uncharacterised protein [Candidatus Anstonella stagnisolia]
MRVEITQAVEKIRKKGIYLVKLGAKEQHAVCQAIVRHLGEKVGAGVYVIVDGKADEVRSGLKKNGVDPSKILFIQCGKKDEGHFEDDRGIRHAYTPTEISLTAADEIASGKYDYLFFNSATTFLMLHDMETTGRFMQYILGKVKLFGITGIVIALNDGHSQALMPMLAELCDEVLEI